MGIAGPRADPAEQPGGVPVIRPMPRAGGEAQDERRYEPGFGEPA